MDDLNKTQLILLALLVSFVTSIATGIVTVTLMDQAPPVVTQTINRVIERTIEVVAPPKDQSVEVIRTVVVKEEEFIAKAAEKNSPNVVEIGRLKKRFRIGGIGKPTTEEFDLELLGVGFALNSSFVVSHNKTFNDTEELVIKTTDNHIYRIEIAIQDAEDDLTLFTIGERVESVGGIEVNIDDQYEFSDVAFAQMDKVQIGQTAIALGSRDGVVLSLGFISQIKTKGRGTTDEGEEIPTEVSSIEASISIDERYAGGPLINMSGEMLGVNIITANNEQSTVPISVVEAILKLYEVETTK